MLNNLNPDAPLFTLTVAQFKSLMASQPVVVEPEKTYVYNLQELARLLGCGLSKIYEVKRSGILDPAIRKNGRKMIIDVNLARELFGSSEGGRK